MKKRILSLLLVLALLLSTAVLFASCGKKKVDLKGYSVVCGSDASESMIREITDFSNGLRKKTGEKVSVVKVAADEEISEEGELEILIGNTNRPETAKALKKIEGHGYTITAVGKKIVIVGTTNLLSLIALDLFIDTYLANKESVDEIELVKTEVEGLEMLEVTKEWSFVYNRYLDGQADQVNVLINNAKNEFTSFSSLQGKSMKQIPDTEAATQEILVGVVDREEHRTAVSGMNANDYGVAVKNGKLMALALNDSMTAKAISLLKNTLQDSVCEKEVDGKKVKQIFIPTDFVRIFTESKANMLTDFPKPEGLSVSGTQDVQNAIEYYYEGEGVSLSAYNTYCQGLLSQGYRLYGNKAEVENSVFATYVNETANLALTVSYNDYKHAEAQGLSYKKGIRIVASKLDVFDLADEKLFTRDLSYDKIQESAITAVALAYNEPDVFGSLYVVSLEDGSYIVLDGGWPTTTDRDKLYSILCDLYKRANHKTDVPTEEDPIRISAWYLTHGHRDHFGSMREFINHYCANYKKYCVTVDTLIANFPSDEENYNSYNPSSAIRDSVAELSSKIKDAQREEPGMKYYRVHTGQRLWLANVELEVMYTHEEAYPRRIHWYNDTSTVIRMNMYHTANRAISEGSKTSMLWLGDAQDVGSQWMRATYGGAIKSDMVQLSHHGGEGCEWELYELAAPMCLWWPHEKERFGTAWVSNAPASDPHGVNHRVLHSPNLKYCILSDFRNYTVTLTASGFNFSTSGSTGIFSAGDGAPVSFGVFAQKPATGLLRKQQ